MNSPNTEREFPYWLLAIGLLFAVMIYVLLSDTGYQKVYQSVKSGLGITIFVTLTAFLLATLWGLLLALGMSSRYRLLRELSRFYVELVRGIPIIVLLFYIAFVASPVLIWMVNWLFTYPQQWGWMEPFIIRDFTLIWRAVFALFIAYGAFIAEIFRAGFQSVDDGQREAAYALGLSPWRTFTSVTFPQAFKTILPPLGNDFISMIKDSALVSVLGVADITQMGKLYAAGSFKFFETYNVVTFLYLCVTISLSLALRGLEKRLNKH